MFYFFYKDKIITYIVAVSTVIILYTVGYVSCNYNKSKSNIMVYNANTINEK